MANTKKEASVVETTETASKKVQEASKGTEQKIKKLSKTYKEMEKETVVVSPMYRAYFGNSLHVAINTKTIYIPCDGTSYLVPKIFADRAREMITKVDEFILKKGRLGNISANVESTPGELQFF